MHLDEADGAPPRAAAKRGAFQLGRLGRFRVEVTERDIALVNWPEEFDGLRVAHLSDIHRGPYMPQYVVDQLVELCNALEPDLVALTGDYVYGPNWLGHRQALRSLGRLRARLGVTACLGNHDWRYRANGRIARELEDSGIVVLENKHLILEENGRRLAIAGVEDLWAANPRLGKATEGVVADAMLMLTHNPDVTARVECMEGAAIRPSFAMAGHTHGGQVVLPVIGSPHVPCADARFLSGLVQLDDFPIYISRGLGMVGVPLRWNCSAELPIHVLRTASKA